MTKPVYEIFIRDTQFRIAGVMTTYGDVELIQRYNDIGYWSITMPDNGNPDTELMKTIFNRNGGYGGIIVVRNKKIIFSGFMRQMEATGDFTSEEDQKQIVFSGWDDTGLLASRVLMVKKQPPIESGGMEVDNPRQFIAPFGQEWGYWEYGPARISQVLYNMVTLNIGPSATQAGMRIGNGPPLQPRRIEQLVVPNPTASGPTYTLRARYENLLLKMQEVASFIPDTGFYSDPTVYDGFMFYIRQTGNGAIQYFQRRPRKRENRVVFSEGRGNLASYRFMREAPASNFVVCGAMNQILTGGSAANPSAGNPDVAPQIGADQVARARFFFHKGSNRATNNLIQQYGLWESFMDRRDIQYPKPQADGSINYNATPCPLYGTPGNATYQAMNTEVTREMAIELIEKRDREEVDITTIDIEPTLFNEPPNGYQLGDRVTVYIPGRVDPIVSRIREINITLTKSQGETIKCVIGKQNAGDYLDIIKDVKFSNKEISKLQKYR